MTENPFLIGPAELQARLGEAGVRVVDASWYLPAEGRDPKADFSQGHVPGAVFLDLDAVVEPGAVLPHTLPTSAAFGEAAGLHGIAADHTIVVYDGAGLFSAARAWWMFRTFGARDVRILDGGLPAWRAAGYETEAGAPEPVLTTFEAQLDEAAVVDFAEMRRIVERGDTQIADARSAERFAGTKPEPRAGVRPGHMPGAHSLPIAELIENGRLKTPDALRAAFAAAGVDPAQPVVTSCGSGVTAAVINLALASTGNGGGRLYDGSWTEWGSAPDTPVETGTGREN